MNKDSLIESIWSVLTTVQDPEVRLDVVNLGLIYSVNVLPLEKDLYRVIIDMTLTSPTCPMAPYIFQSIHDAVECLPNVDNLVINLIWEPAWSKDKISEEGKMELGLM